MPVPLIVDGPLKGKEIELPQEYYEQGSFQWVMDDTPDEAVGRNISPTGVRSGTVTYRRHYYGILGHRLIIWSLARDFQSISFQDLRDLFGVIISDRGKAAEHIQ